jgi:hypothetical protein
MWQCLKPFTPDGLFARLALILVYLADRVTFACGQERPDSLAGYGTHGRSRIAWVKSAMALSYTFSPIGARKSGDHSCGHSR